MSETFDTESIIREYITQVIHMSLSTTKDNKPRVFELHFAYDDQLNLYFVSGVNAHHSEDIRNNPNVAGSIVTQHFLNQKVRGVYFDGTAKELDDLDEMQQAYKAYTERYHDSPQLARVAQAEGNARFYKVTVNNFYVVDGLLSDTAQQYHLPWSD
jgi:uncharacterized protein YhbP (UPF0306 family)